MRHPRLCVVNESLVKFFFGRTNPLRKHITDLFPGAVATLEIAAVVRDVRDRSLRDQIGGASIFR
jgi:hypothetical protein